MYAAGALIASRTGLLVDRLGAVRTLRLLPLAVAACAALVAAAPTYIAVLAAAVLAGGPLAATNPATNRVVSATFPPGRRGVVMGWKQAGVAVGAAIAGAALPTLASAIGWRQTLLVVGAACLVGTALLTRLPFQDDATHGADHAPATLPALLDLDLAALLLGAANGAVAAYLVLFAAAELGFSPQRAGLAAALMAGVSILARVVWAWAGEHTGAPERCLAVLAVVAALGAGTLVLAAISGRPELLWLATVLLGVSTQSWHGLLMLTGVERVPTRDAGRVSGRLTRSFYGGYVLGPIAFGAIVDFTVFGYRGAWLATVLAGATTSVMVMVMQPHRLDRESSSSRPRVNRGE
jgi:MFS family permease